MKELKYVKKRDYKYLIRNSIIEVEHWSDDGEFVRYRILPNGPVFGEWANFGEKLLVVDCDTVHENVVNGFPQLYEEVSVGDL